jgi:hypothetical protein
VFILLEYAAAAINPGSLYHLPFAHMSAAILHNLVREHEKAEFLATRTLELCEKYKIASLTAVVRCALGYARAHLGRAVDGIELIRRGLGEALDTQSRVVITDCTLWLAVAQQRAGFITDAIESVEQAFQFNPEELIHRPEILRVRGELRRAKDKADLAEVDFRDSIALARTMGAKAWELRTTMSLARLLASKGRREEARTLLAEIYNWFTEGFDTVDLKDGKELLDELSA